MDDYKEDVEIIVTACCAPVITDMCLGSLVNQEYRIIVIDNNSLEATKESIKKYEKHCKIISTDKMLSYAECCNLGIQNSKAPFLVFSHNDCLFPDGLIEQLFQNYWRSKATFISPVTNFCDENEYLVDIGIRDSTLSIHREILNKDEEFLRKQIQLLYSRYLEKEGSLNSFKAFSKKLKLEEGKEESVPTSFCFLTGRKVFEEYGHFNQNFLFRGYEEKELFSRIPEARWIKDNSSLVHHWGHITTGRFGFNRKMMFESNFITYKRLSSRAYAIRD